jgi:antitoxin (DNA-binding transcriptional repressor) of toxin-antitoxin stability system
MTIQIDVAQLGPALVEDLSQNGGEITLTRDGKPVAKLVRVEGAADAPSSDPTRPDGKVFYKGRWMSAAGAERERSIEHLRGSVKILGDIISPIDESDGPMAGTIIFQGDIVSPLDEEWEADK